MNCTNLYNKFYLKIKHLFKLLEEKEINYKEKNFFDIAVSAGVDSISLLYCLDWFIKNNNLKTKLHVITINHGLRPESDMETKYVESLSKKIGAYSSIINLNFTENNFNQNKARKERFNAINKTMKSNFLFLGHHYDDQLETVLIRARYKSGIIGLGGIADIIGLDKNIILRPFLNINKSTIIANANKNDWKWLEDKSNNSNKYTRNLYRKELIDNDHLYSNLSLLQHLCKNWRNDFNNSFQKWFKENVKLCKPEMLKLNLNNYLNFVNHILIVKKEKSLEISEILIKIITFDKTNDLIYKNNNLYMGALVLQKIFSKINQHHNQRLTTYAKTHLLISKHMKNTTLTTTLCKHILELKNNFIYIKKEPIFHENKDFKYNEKFEYYI